ncbi:MAG: tetratricopeptide repeat protein [Candidatus Omnitrophica bacterium]|nr:tetratricopeptide repeat protein [Candidatus Omnitrophota bacterium]
MRRLTFVFTIILGLSAFLFKAYPTTIQLKSGKTLEATILEKTDNSLKVEYNGKIIFYKLYYLKNIDGIDPAAYKFIPPAPPPEKEETSVRAQAVKDKKSEKKQVLSDTTQTSVIINSSDTLASIYQQGVTRMLDGDITGAEEYFKAGLDIDPTHARLWEALKMIRLMKTGGLDREYIHQFFLGIQSIMGEDYRKAIHIFTSLTKRPGDNSQVYINLGLTHYVLEEYGQAITYLQESLKKNPQDTRTHHILGMAYYAEGNYSEAIKSLEYYLKTNPQDAEALWTLSMSQYISGYYPQAKANFSIAQMLFQDEGNKEKVAEIEYFLKELL